MSGKMVITIMVLYFFLTLGSFFSLELDMYPPHPHEYSVDMIEFLLNNTDLMDFLNWQVDSSRVLYSSPMFSVPSPLFYRYMSKLPNHDQIVADFFDTSKI